MKQHPKNALMVSLAVVAALVSGCEPAYEEPTVSTPQPSSQEVHRQAEQVKQETAQAVDAAKDYLTAQRQQFAAEMRSALDALKADMDNLAARAEKAGDAAKAESEVKLAEIRRQADRLREELDGLTDATDSTWDEVKKGLQKSYDTLKESATQAQRWLSEKLEPGAGS